MDSKLTEEDQTRLWQAVQAIEQVSQAEVVVVFRARSADYAEVPLWLGVILAWVVHTYLMYAPVTFVDALVYFGPLFGFVAGFALGHLPVIKRLSTRPARLLKNVEIMGRALFQKGGLQHTRDKIGLLIYCSWLERQVLLVPDRELELAVPLDEWQRLRQRFNAIFAAAKPLDALLDAMGEAQTLFADCLPIQPDDINDLPDQMEIDL